MARRQLATALVEADRVMSEINKDLGPDTLIWGSNIHYDKIPRITSGSLSLDIALGGGWTVGSWHEVYGDESTAKTTIVLKTIAAQQQTHKNWVVFWIAAEDFVSSWAQMLGCDLKQIMVMQTNVLEDATDAALKMLESRTIDCLVIDSLPALSPITEAEHGMEDQQIGLAARLLGKFFRKANTAMRRSLVEVDRPVTCFVVNQWREKVGVMYGDNRITPGGRAKNYWFFTRVQLTRDDWITEGERKNQRHVGLVVKGLVKKNKTAPPGRTATIDFLFDHNELGIAPGDYDTVKELIGLGIFFDVIKAGGGHYKYGDYSWHGRPAMEDELRQDLGLREQLVTAVMVCATKGPPVIEPQPRKTRRKLSST